MDNQEGYMDDQEGYMDVQEGGILFRGVIYSSGGLMLFRGVNPPHTTSTTNFTSFKRNISGEL